jgi:hypothetical protein
MGFIDSVETVPAEVAKQQSITVRRGCGGHEEDLRWR